MEEINRKLSIVAGDITKQLDIDVIVNAANPLLEGGGGVCGAIFKAAGWDDLQTECNKFPVLNEDGWRCPFGWSQITSACRLPNKAIIHAVGPVYKADRAEQMRMLLRSAYESSLKLASSKGYKSIAFPAISCGVYRYPWEEAASIALKTCDAYFRNQTDTVLEEIRFVIFEPELLKIFETEAQKLHR